MRAPVHLNALRAFEASARHGSFSGAAEELNVSATAVGQMVRNLEDWLGAPLFHRAPSGRSRLVATEAAERALPDVRAGFERLALGLGRLRAATASGVLTVTTSPAFATKWMLSRLDRFRARWPEVNVQLDTDLRLADYATHGIDIGVRYGAGNWPGLKAVPLMREEIFPVCSPSFNADPRKAQDLVGLTLIHDQSVAGAAGFVTWDAWLSHVGVEAPAPERGLRINNSAAVLQAAIDGQGVALARSVLARDDLVEGRLKRLVPDAAMPATLAYFVTYRPERETLPGIAAFRDWLLEEAATA